MKKSLAAVAVVAIGGALAYNFFYRQSPESPAQAPQASSASRSVATDEPVIKYPAPGTPDQEGGSPRPLAQGSNPFADHPSAPSADVTDPTLADSLVDLLGKERVDRLLNLDGIIRRIVVTVDAWGTEHKGAADFSPIKPIHTDFAVMSAGEAFTISPMNFSRYTPYVNLVASLDLKKAILLYGKYYRRFQSAYKDLNQSGYFNDRAVEVIDLLLETPEVNGPIVVRPIPDQARYEHVDEQLEALRVGQKLLLRMGPENAVVLKGKLRELRNLLTGGKK